MPVIAAWSFFTTSGVGMSWGLHSLMSRSMTNGTNTYLVHDAKDDLFIICKPACKLVPEMLELRGGSGDGVGIVSNDTATARLLRGV